MHHQRELDIVELEVVELSEKVEIPSEEKIMGIVFPYSWIIVSPCKHEWNDIAQIDIYMF